MNKIVIAFLVSFYVNILFPQKMPSNENKTFDVKDNELSLNYTVFSHGYLSWLKNFIFLDIKLEFFNHDIYNKIEQGCTDIFQVLIYDSNGNKVNSVVFQMSQTRRGENDVLIQNENELVSSEKFNIKKKRKEVIILNYPVKYKSETPFSSSINGYNLKKGKYHLQVKLTLENDEFVSNKVVLIIR